MENNQQQADYWASAAGMKWIEHEHALDTAMAGMLELMLDAADIKPFEQIIDIGCGTGASTLSAAHNVPQGEVLGVDISAPLLDRARLRAKEEDIRNASFLLADAQNYSFNQQKFDLLISRIGMSFFNNPVAAFKNLANALNTNGRMVFVSWAPVSKNPWFYLPKQAAEERLGILPKTAPNAPGPTAFQHCEHVLQLMKNAGLSKINAKAIEITLTPPDGASGAAKAASRVGPAARIMKAFNGTKSDEKAIEASVERSFAVYKEGPSVLIPATVNLFTCFK